MSDAHDVAVVRALAQQYAEVAADPVQEARRQLWSDHNSLERTRVPILVNFGMWNVWCREVFGDAALTCRDPFYREHERALRMKLLQASIGDDTILEPWITQQATQQGTLGWMWGVPETNHASDMPGGAWRFDPPLKTWDDVAKLRPVPHGIDEETTARNTARLHDAVGDILPIDVHRGCAYSAFGADISTNLAKLRGLEQVMEDMYDAPAELHRLLAFMRDHILTAQAAAEAAGDYSLTSGVNQAMTYCHELEAPRANSGARPRSALWAFCAAQEFTLISPAMHDEFLLQYQLPLMTPWGLVAYGCCEDLTRKIDMLRQIPNLRQVAVTPVADVQACAEGLGDAYVMSWRPNPTNMVCCGFDEAFIRATLRAGLDVSRDCRVHLHLKDIETVEGDLSRLSRWTQIAREVCAELALA